MSTATVTDLSDALARLSQLPDPTAWSFILESIGQEIETLSGRLTGDRELAKDCTQETLLQVRDHAGNFRLRPDDRDPHAAARRWILRVAANTAIKLMTSQARMRRRHERSVARDNAVQESPGEHMEREENAKAIRSALADLPEKQRSAIVLHHLSGLEFTDVAAELGCPIGTAKTHTARGLERMRAFLQRHGFALSIAAIASALTELPSSASEFSVAEAVPLLTSPTQASVSAVSFAGGLPIAFKVGIALAVAATAGAYSFAGSDTVKFKANAAADGKNMQQIVASIIAYAQDQKSGWPVVIPDGINVPVNDPHEARLVTAASFEWLAKCTKVGPKLFVSKFHPVDLPAPRTLEEIKAKPNIDWAAGFAYDWAVPDNPDPGRVVIAQRTLVTNPVSGMKGIFTGAGDGSYGFNQAMWRIPSGHRTEGNDGTPMPPVFVIIDKLRSVDDIFTSDDDGDDSGTPGAGSQTHAWVK